MKETPLDNFERFIKKEQIYNENHDDTFTKSESKGSGWVVIILMSVILLLSLSTAHFREEMKARDKTIKIQEAEIKRLEGSNHNPFVHARK